MNLTEVDAVVSIIGSLGTLIVVLLAVFMFKPQRREVETAGDLNEVQAMETLVRGLQSKIGQMEMTDAQKSVRVARAEESAVNERIASAKALNRMEDNLTTLNRRVTDGEKSLLAEQEKVAKLETQLTEATRENRRLRKLYLDQSADYETLSKKVDELTAKLARYKNNGKGKADG